MSPIPPTGGAPQRVPPPSQPTTQQQAQELAKITRSFVDQSYDLLKFPSHADSPDKMGQFAETIKQLHEQASKALGG